LLGRIEPIGTNRPVEREATSFGVTDDISDTVRGRLLGSHTIYLKKSGEEVPQDILGGFPLLSTDQGLRGALNYVWWSLEPLKLRWYLNSRGYVSLLKELKNLKDVGEGVSTRERVVRFLANERYGEHVFPYSELKQDAGVEFSHGYPVSNFASDQIEIIETLESLSKESKPLCELAGKSPKTVSRPHPGFSRARYIEREVFAAPLVWEHVREEGEEGDGGKKGKESIKSYVEGMKELDYMGFDDEELAQYSEKLRSVEWGLRREWNNLLPAYLAPKKKFDRLRGIFN